jgi:hypothetical protein
MIIHSIVALEDIITPPPYAIPAKITGTGKQPHPVNYRMIKQNDERCLPVTDPRIALQCCEYITAYNKK